jgi:Flp pilus assembly protein CpaB
MNKRFLSVVVFGLVVAGAASFILYQLITSRISASASAATTSVVVATHDLQIGALIKDSDLKLAAWAGPVPQGASATVQDVMGRGVTAAIVSGEPVLSSRLAPRGAGAGMAATIPQGMRAVAVSVNDVVGVAGFVVPGMRVDIPERFRGQADTSAGGEPAGDSGAGRDPEPGEPRNAHSINPSQSDRHGIVQDIGHNGGQSVWRDGERTERGVCGEG